MKDNNAPGLKSYFSFGPGLFLVLFLVLMINGRSVYLHDPGTFFHTRVGEIILSETRFVHVDEFTFQFTGRPWVAQQWLGEVFMASLYRIGGFDTSLMFFCLLLAIIYSWIAVFLRQAGMNYLLVALFLVFILASSTHHFLLRPQLFSLAFIGLIFSLLLKVENRHLALKFLWVFPPIIALWSNIHGAALGGIGTVSIAFTGWVFFYFLGWSSPIDNCRQIFMLLLVLVLCFLAPLVNPFGLELYKTWQTIMASPSVAQYIQEHVGMFRVWFGCFPLLVGVLYLAGLTGTWKKHQKVVWYLPLVWFAMSVGRLRHAPIFAIITGIALSDFYNQISWVHWLREKGSVLFSPVTFESKPFWKPILIITIFVLALGSILQFNHIHFPVIGSGWAKIDENYWPVSLIPDLKHFAFSQGKNAPIFNEMLFGGFLTFYLPEVKIFIDDRCELSKDEGLEGYVAAAKDHAKLQAYEEKYCFKGALTIPGSGFDKYFATSPAWHQMAKSSVAVFYTRGSDSR